MGNTIRRLVGACLEPPTSDQFQVGGQYPGQYPNQYPGQYPGQYGPQGGAHGHHGGPQGHHGVPAHSEGFAALARDLFQFETTNKVPDGLSQYVNANKATQVSWYRKLLAAWKNVQPAPTTPDEASALLRQALQGQDNADVQALLSFYGLPGSATGVPAAAAGHHPSVAHAAGGTWPQGVQYEIHTLPVEDRSVGDGDTITVFVDVHKDAREVASVPQGIMEAVSRRRTARAHHDYNTADALQSQIQEAGYKIFDAKNGREECITRKYRVRLMGVDAPESNQPFGQQAKAILSGLVEGRPLVVHVYTVDQYGRLVGDIHCNGTFIQEALLKKGCVWHYTQFDHRQTFAQWERDAKAARVGLWAVVDPEKPWEYRKDHKIERGPPRR